MMCNFGFEGTKSCVPQFRKSYLWWMKMCLQVCVKCFQVKNDGWHEHGLMCFESGYTLNACTTHICTFNQMSGESFHWTCLASNLGFFPCKQRIYYGSTTLHYKPRVQMASSLINDSHPLPLSDGMRSFGWPHRENSRYAGIFSR